MKALLIIHFILIYSYVFPNDSDTSFAIYHNNAIKARKNGNIAVSINILNKSLELCTDNVDSFKVYTSLSAAYIELSDYATALVFLEKANSKDVDLNPSILYNNYGLVYSNLELYDKAINYYRKAENFTRKEGLGRIYHNMGKCFSWANQEDSAIYYFDLAFKTKSKTIGINSYSTLLSGLELAEFKPEILNDLEAYIKEQNNNLLSGIYYSLKKDYHLAEHYYRGNHYYLLKLYTKTRQWEKAIIAIDSLRSSYISLKGKLFRAENERMIYKNAIDSAIKTDTMLAFNYALKSRANILKDRIDEEKAINYPESYNYFEFDSVIYFFYLGNRNNLEFIKIKADSVFWNHYYSYISSFNPDVFKKDFYNTYLSYCESGDYLYKKLVPHIAKEMLIIPDGLLHFISFDCLPIHTPDTSFPDYRNIDYLFKYSSISYDYVLRNYPPPPSGKLQIVAFAPDPTLKFSMKEVEDLRKNYQANIFTNTININEIYNGDILHISTHYSPASKNFFFGTGRGLCVDSLQKKDRELVVIASCYSGFGEEYTGEGVFSPGRAFYNSGAKSIVETIWQSDDESTSLIIRDFYKYLSNGENKAKALNMAKLKFLNNTITNEHPYYWGHIRIFGKRTSLKLPKRLNAFIIVTTSLMIITITIMLLKYLSRKR